MLPTGKLSESIKSKEIMSGLINHDDGHALISRAHKDYPLAEVTRDRYLFFLPIPN